jgi:hypothetical protein
MKIRTLTRTDGKTWNRTDPLGQIRGEDLMPKLFEYRGITVLFYSNEHQPIHVHGKREGRETKAELIVEEGQVVKVVYSPVRGRRPLTKSELKHFRTLIELYADEIVGKWIDYFVLHKPVEPQTISDRLR